METERITAITRSKTDWLCNWVSQSPFIVKCSSDVWFHWRFTDGQMVGCSEHVSYCNIQWIMLLFLLPFSWGDNPNHISSCWSLAAFLPEIHCGEKNHGKTSFWVSHTFQLTTVFALELIKFVAGAQNVLKSVHWLNFSAYSVAAKSWSNHDRWSNSDHRPELGFWIWWIFEGPCGASFEHNPRICCRV